MNNRLSVFRPLSLLVIALLSLALIVTACGSKDSNNGNASSSNTSASGASGTKEIRIGYQKYGTVNILKAKGTLDKRLESEGYKITWTEFPGGPQLLEALNVGSIDIGHTGEAPPIFAQAADAPLVYLAHEPESPNSEGIIVPKGSAIASIADLKGKKVALNKGSNVHYLLVKALEKAGVDYNDITTVFLPPGDARVAFENGTVDAWVIWDPFLAAAQTATGGKLLTDGEGLVSNIEYYLASRKFAEANGPVIDIFKEELNKIDEWSAANQKEVAALLSPQLGIDAPSLELAAGRRGYGLQPIDDSIIEAQQKIADTFFGLKLIPKEIQVKDATLK
ncbi:sulfonate ABC transporter substrate-binding protein [Paenibacillus sacheonensis]|uniref:Putative aliphatic sulfonates-binding protein n=1 Tax=Paenibacillus sacheonensis TaxID=742054 RepID=A0A7X4YLK6_9BACL|nr:sulfonate ABC transporter substrate-binding protein [Paenibacillus sacheonensis]MBM7566088.1 sulfonate transport system substrate-binding protein [Paenibacillus sacheonensis]NBC68603.1 aliphatic sulfonate ABC transporter substrate-binding protein [Paenibacillus sacheonensis]